MRIWRMTSLVSAAPGGASMPGTEIAGPPGCANGTGGRSNRSRSRPGWSLGGTICAPGGTTCATAANETLTIAKAAAMARTRANMPPTLDERAEILRYGQTRSQCRQLSHFGNFSSCLKKITPASAMLQVAGCQGPGDSGGTGGLPSSTRKLLPMTVLICGSPASGLQIIGLFANSADAQSYAEDYSLKDWWVAELGICGKSSGDGFEVPSLTDFRNRLSKLVPLCSAQVEFHMGPMASAYQSSRRGRTARL